MHSVQVSLEIRTSRFSLPENVACPYVFGVLFGTVLQITASVNCMLGVCWSGDRFTGVWGGRGVCQAVHSSLGLVKEGCNMLPISSGA